MGEEIRWYSRWEVTPEDSPIHPARPSLVGQWGVTWPDRGSLTLVLSCDPKDGAGGGRVAGLVLPDAVALGPDTGAPGLGVVWGRSQVEDPGRSRCERGHRPAGLPKHAPPARLLRGRAGPQPQAHFPFKLGLQPVSPALPMRARLGSGGRALWSGLVPAGWQVHPRRTGGAAPGPSPEAPAAPLRSAGGDHSGSRRGCPEKALAAPWTPAALPPGPSLALASGRKCQQRPLQRCRPGHSFHRARGSASPRAQEGL